MACSGPSKYLGVLANLSYLSEATYPISVKWQAQSNLIQLASLAANKLTQALTEVNQLNVMLILR